MQNIFAINTPIAASGAQQNKMKKSKIVTSLLFSTIMSVNAQVQHKAPIQYPETRKGTQTDVYFGTSVSDPYRWLEDDRADDTKAWVEQENTVTNNYLARIPCRKEFKARLKELWNYEKYTAPFKEGDFTYFYKNNGLQNQYVLYRQEDDKSPHVFLDPNRFSVDGTSSLQGIEFSKDGSYAAYQVSEGGSDWRKVYVMETKTMKIVDDTLQDIKFSGLAWLRNEGFYYSSYDKPKGSELSEMTQVHKLYFHKRGTPQSEDKLIFGGDQLPRRYIGASVTEDQKYLIISAANATYGNELYIQDLSVPNAPIKPIITGFENEHSVAFEENDVLYIETNLNAPNHRLVMADAQNPQVESWRDAIPETKFPLSVSTCGHKLFAHYLKDAVSEVIQYNMEGVKEKTITLPGLGTASGFSGKTEEQEVYYTFTSYIYPTTIFKYDLKKGTSEVYKEAGIKFNPADFESKQVFYTSADGTKVPMIITCKKGLKMDGKNPTMLYGYGGFNISMTPSFSVSNLVFLENGGIYCVANLRGGGEYGDTWHLAGTKMNKQNVFNDFIAAAEYLIKEKYTSKEFLAISGGSNGGLLIGACMTQRPDLFQVCFPAVGVLDMLRYNKFTAGAGWAFDYGTAQDSKEMFEYLYKYSPLHNLKEGTCYPATLVLTGDHDDRVVPAHSFKFAATLQAAQKCDNPVLIRIETKAGHGAGKPTDMLIAEQADKWAFMFYNMGLDYKAEVK